MSLLYWFPCTDGTFKNQGIYNTQLTNISTSSIVSDNNGKLGKCVRLAGAVYNDNFTALSTNNYSISYWIKYGAFPTYNEYVVCINGTDSSDMLVSVGVQTPNGTLSINARGIGTNLSLNTWYHICYTHTGSTGKVYLNGNLIKTLNITGNVNASHLTINGRYGSRPLISQDYINDLRIYNHTLSAKEVEEISKGLVLHYKLDHGGLGGENIITNSTGYLGTTHWNGLITQAIDTDGRPYLIAKRTDTTSTSRTFCTYTPAITSYVASWTPGSKFTISGYYKVPSSETQETGGNMFIRWSKASASNGDTDTGFTTSTAVKDTWIRFENTYTVPPNWDGSINAANFYISAFAAQKRATVYWKDLKMELGEKATPWSPAKADSNYPTNFDTTIYDCSGYGNNGTVIGTLNAVADSPRYEVATVFNGTDSAIKVTNNNWCSQGMEALTINIWAKASSWSAKKLFSCTETGGFNTEGGSSGYLRFPVHVYTNTEKTSTAYKYDSKEIKISDLSTTDWVMITFVYDLTGTKTYINGELHHTYSNTSYGIHFNMNARLFLGCEANTANPSTPYLDGQESDFRIYATALSAAAIKELYDTSASIDASGNIYARELVE